MLILVAGCLVVLLFLQSLLMVYRILLVIFEGVGESMGEKESEVRYVFGR